ncbi:hypothetical protein GCM10018790_44860 [Kitasatospora xanthocidica]|nr:hypothetical protein GCM10018790_44860 [Kitasatospora xanthocidica]
MVARSPRSLAELSVVRAEAAQPLWQAEDGDWRILQTAGPVEAGVELAAETGAPALVFQVLDSDVVFARAFVPGGRSWHCAFPADMALDYEVPEKWIGEPGEVAPRATGWAEAAGLRPDEAEVRAVLERDTDPVAESLVLDLVHALGFRFQEG